MGRANGSGYGGATMAGVARGAHRIAYTLTYGPIGNRYVLHHCDNRMCCNPAHLWLGTQRENLADMNAKGRGNHEAKRHLGSAHGRAKLTEADVLAIRERVGTGVIHDPVTGRYIRHSNQQELAAEYGVSRGLISQIAVGRIWKHV